MKLTLEEQNFIFRYLWEAKLKKEVCKTDTLINLLAQKRYHPLNLKNKNFLQKYILKERKKVSYQYSVWEETVSSSLQNKFDFLPEKIIRRWELLGLSEKIVDINFFIFVVNELFYCSGKRDLSDENIHFKKTSLIKEE
jgi:hypothetical protein